MVLKRGQMSSVPSWAGSPAPWKLRCFLVRGLRSEISSAARIGCATNRIEDRTIRFDVFSLHSLDRLCALFFSSRDFPLQQHASSTSYVAMETETKGRVTEIRHVMCESSFREATRQNVPRFRLLEPCFVTESLKGGFPSCKTG